MTKQIPWLRVLVEGIVIVGSILLAFGIDAWWEGRQERERHAEVLTSLRSEFATNREVLPGRFGLHQRLESGTAELIRFLQTVEPGQAVHVADSLVALTVLSSTWDARTGALDAVLQSGDLQAIRDLRLREALAAWPSQVADARENEDFIRNQQDPAIRTFLMKELDLAPLLDLLYEGDEWPPSGTIRLQSSTELTSLLGTKRIFMAEVIQEQRRLMHRADSVIAMIDAEMRSRE